MSITGVKVKLVGEDGNAFAIMGRVAAAMRKAGVHKNVVDEYTAEAMSGDYDHLLATTLKYVDHTDDSDWQEEWDEDEDDEICEDCGWSVYNCECDA